MTKTQTTLHLEGKTLYIVKASGWWSIIIMPDGIVIDNYHNKGGHIHPNPLNHKEEKEIKYNTQNENLNLIISQLKEIKN